MLKETIVSVYNELGKFLVQFNPGGITENDSILNKIFFEKTVQIIDNEQHNNGWYTPQMVSHALYANGLMLSGGNIEQWLKNYILAGAPGKNIGVVMAGNIPMVGFHDLLCVLASGNRFTGKMSSKDNRLMVLMAEIIGALDPETGGKIHFTEEHLTGCDAYIATGSNNTSRYFQYYFGKYPHVIRRNRNSAAVITGRETPEEMENLSDDIFLYFGLGCRSVAKVFLPTDYPPENLFGDFKKWENIIMNNKYYNNYQYNKAIFMVNRTKYYDNGFLLVTGNSLLSSPVAVLYYEFYDDEKQLTGVLQHQRAQLQCIVSSAGVFENPVFFGKSQYPNLWDYADNIDTMNFLLNL